MSLKQFIAFTSDGGGLEKILRFLQAISQVLAAVAVDQEEVQTWLLLRAQFALGRRYLRFFRFLDAFQKAWSCFLTTRGVELLFGVGKFGFLGGYLFLESVTILDIMNVWPTDWAKICFIEANKLWFYSLMCSIMGSCLQLWYTASVKQSAGKAEKSGEKLSNEGRAKTHIQRAKVSEKAGINKTHLLCLLRSIVIDASDLFLPGAVTGWLVTGPLTVGVATIISTTLSSKDIWDKYGG